MLVKVFLPDSLRWTFITYTLASLLLFGDNAGEDHAKNQKKHGIPSTLAGVETS